MKNTLLEGAWPWKTHGSHLMLDSLSEKFPFTKIELMEEVSLLQMIDEAHAKDAIDRITMITPDVCS